MNKFLPTGYPILDQIRGLKAGLFIDNANWFYPQKELGWKISYKNLRSYLKKYLKLEVAKFYIGTPQEPQRLSEFKEICRFASLANFQVVTKPIKKIFLDSNRKNHEFKCNFDVEISLDIARHVEKIDLVIIGSGDSDFVEVKRFALEKGKKFLVLCFEKGVAWEIRRLHHVFLEKLKADVEYKKPRNKSGVSKY